MMMMLRCSVECNAVEVGQTHDARSPLLLSISLLSAFWISVKDCEHGTDNYCDQKMSELIVEAG